MTLTPTIVEPPPFSVAVPRLAKVCMNGDFVDASEARVSVFDHGLLYGDGVFDTIAAVDGKIFWLAEHVDRLLDGCRTLGIEPLWTRDALIRWTGELFERNQIPTVRLRITITRGEGEVPLYGWRSCRPNLIIFGTPLDLPADEYYERGLAIRTVCYRRIEPRVKSLCFLASVLAYMEASEAGADDAVFITGDGLVTEGTTFNIFAVREGAIFTPAEGILNGVTRAKVCDLARETGHSVVEGHLPLSLLCSAEEAFITGTTKRVVPVRMVDDFVIGDGAPGAVTRELLGRFRRLYF